VDLYVCVCVCVCVCVRYKDGVELSASDRLTMSCDADEYTLSIHETSLSDAGAYKITAVNDNSRLSCSATLLVLGKYN